MNISQNPIGRDCVKFFDKLRSRSAVRYNFKCTICESFDKFIPYEVRVDSGGNLHEICMCLGCLAVLDASNLQGAQNESHLSLQADSSDEFYSVDEKYLMEVSNLIEQNQFFDFLFNQYPSCPRGTLLDFGAGRGILAGSGAKYFSKVYAADLSLNILSQIHELMPLKSKVHLTDDIFEIQDNYDVITSMHVLEHLPNLRKILNFLVSRLNPSGCLFFQVPLMCNEYLTGTHYTFFTAASAQSLAIELGLQVVGVWYDNQRNFLTCIAKK